MYSNLRYQLSVPLLESQNKRVEKEVQAWINECEKVIMLSDGWCNIQSEGIYNIIISTPKSVFTSSSKLKQSK